MNVRRFSLPFERSLVGVLVLMGCWSSGALAQAGHAHEPSAQDRSKSSALVNVVRQSTERFKDVAVAEARRVRPAVRLRQRADSGAMGLHYVNAAAGDGRRARRHASRDRDLRADCRTGRLRLIGADYLVFADAWNAKHSGGRRS